MKNLFSSRASAPAKFAVVAVIMGWLIMSLPVVVGVGPCFAQNQAEQGAPVYDPAPPPGEEGQQPGFMAALLNMMPMLLMCYFIYFFMVVKPQEKKVKEHKELLTTLKRGDTVVTSSGIIGKMAGNEQDLVVLEIASNVKIRVEPAHVLRKFEEKKAA